MAEKWQGDGIYYTYFDGTSWAPEFLVHEPDSGGFTGRSDIAIDNLTGTGCVVWSGYHYRFFYNTTWDTADSIAEYHGGLSSLTASPSTFHLVWCKGMEIYYSKHIVPGIEETSYRLRVAGSRLKAYPNPFMQFAEIRCQMPDVRIQVYDMMGRLVEERFFADAQNDRLKIGKDLTAGIYFVKMRGYKPVKIIKMGGVR